MVSNDSRRLDSLSQTVRAAASPEGSPCIWTLAFGHHEGRTPTHGHEATRKGCHGRLCQELAAGVVFPA
jgi:hypothetical protein